MSHETAEEQTLRKVRVLVEEEREFKDLRKGDIFRTLPACETDVWASPDSFHIAETDAKAEKPPANWGLQVSPIAFVKGVTPRFLQSSFQRKAKVPE